MIEELLQESQQMQNYLEVTTSEDPSELLERLSILNTYLARTGKMLADAKQLRDRAINAAYSEHSKSIIKMPATIAAKFIETVSADENYLVNWLDRLNRTCVHQGDNIRTQISFAKEELKLTRNGYQSIK